MRWILGVVLMVGVALHMPGDAAGTLVETGPILTKVAQLSDQEYARMYKRFSGVWLRNGRRSYNTSGGNTATPASSNVADELLHYDPQPDGKTIIYYQNNAAKQYAVRHYFDGRKNPRSTNPEEPFNDYVVRVPLDEYTVASTLIRRKDGSVRSHLTFAMSPDGDAGVYATFERDEKTGKWKIGTIIHYCRPDNKECLNQ